MLLDNWEYYDEENIENGFIVFENVESLVDFKYSPNDYIDLDIEKLGDNLYQFNIYPEHCSVKGEHKCGHFRLLQNRFIYLTRKS